MNWIGGARSRIRGTHKRQKQIQKEYFERKRLDIAVARSMRRQKPNENEQEAKKAISQDIILFQNDCRVASAPNPTEATGCYRVVNLSKKLSNPTHPINGRRIEYVHLPLSPIETPSTLQLSSSTASKESHPSSSRLALKPSASNQHRWPRTLPLPRDWLKEGQSMPLPWNYDQTQHVLSNKCPAGTKPPPSSALSPALSHSSRPIELFGTKSKKPTASVSSSSQSHYGVFGEKALRTGHFRDRSYYNSCCSPLRSNDSQNVTANLPPICSQPMTAIDDSMVDLFDREGAYYISLSSQIPGEGEPLPLESNNYSEAFHLESDTEESCPLIGNILIEPDAQLNQSLTNSNSFLSNCDQNNLRDIRHLQRHENSFKSTPLFEIENIDTESRSQRMPGGFREREYSNVDSRSAFTIDSVRNTGKRMDQRYDARFGSNWNDRSPPKQSVCVQKINTATNALFPSHHNTFNPQSSTSRLYKTDTSVQFLGNCSVNDIFNPKSQLESQTNDSRSQGLSNNSHITFPPTFSYSNDSTPKPTTFQPRSEGKDRSSKRSAHHHHPRGHSHKGHYESIEPQGHYDTSKRVEAMMEKSTGKNNRRMDGFKILDAHQRVEHMTNFGYSNNATTSGRSEERRHKRSHGNVSRSRSSENKGRVSSDERSLKYGNMHQDVLPEVRYSTTRETCPKQRQKYSNEAVTQSTSPLGMVPLDRHAVEISQKLKVHSCSNTQEYLTAEIHKEKDYVKGAKEQIYDENPLRKSLDQDSILNKTSKMESDTPTGTTITNDEVVGHDDNDLLNMDTEREEVLHEANLGLLEVMEVQDAKSLMEYIFVQDNEECPSPSTFGTTGQKATDNNSTNVETSDEIVTPIRTNLQQEDCRENSPNFKPPCTPSMSRKDNSSPGTEHILLNNIDDAKVQEPFVDSSEKACLKYSGDEALDIKFELNDETLDNPDGCTGKLNSETKYEARSMSRIIRQTLDNTPSDLGNSLTYHPDASCDHPIIEPSTHAIESNATKTPQSRQPRSLSVEESQLISTTTLQMTSTISTGTQTMSKMYTDMASSPICIPRDVKELQCSPMLLPSLEMDENYCSMGKGYNLRSCLQLEQKEP